MNKTVIVKSRDIEKYGLEIALFISGFMKMGKQIITNNISNCKITEYFENHNGNFKITITDKPYVVDVNTQQLYVEILQKVIRVLRLTAGYFEDIRYVDYGFHQGKINKVGDMVLYKEGLDIENIKNTIKPFSKRDSEIPTYELTELNGVKYVHIC